ncbi:unnamed protein product, partial [Adineta steineri]
AEHECEVNDVEGGAEHECEVNDVEGGAEHECEVNDVEGGAEHECEVNDVEGGAEHECEVNDVEGGAEHNIEGDAERGVECEVNSIPAAHEFDVEIEIVDEELCNNSSSFTQDHNYNSSTIVKDNLKKKRSTSARGNHRVRYLPGWEKKDEAQYVTYVFDNFGEKHEKFLRWLYQKNGSMFCCLCEKYGKLKNSNGKDNVWSTTGMATLSFDKIKLHKEKSEVHKQAESQELTVSSRSQPNWPSTKQKQLSKQEMAIQSLMLSCIFLCQQDNSLNSIEPLCALLEALNIQLLPAETTGVNYRNDTAALSFLQHIADYVHSELVDKIKKRWMMDESTSRSTEKSCIIYVRFVENFEAKTSFYGLVDLEGDGTANNIVKALTNMWKNDGLDATNSCWLATDNASTFTGIHEGVIAKLRRYLCIDWLEINGCVAHSFALVGKQASYEPKTANNKKPVVCDSVVKLESTISQIYNYFAKSTGHQFKLKSWQAFLEMPELKFKRIFDIRWLSIRGCIKPIIDNVQPGSQALLGCLQHILSDTGSSKLERANSKHLLESILDDEFLFLLHMHYDLHETILAEKRKILQHWSFKSTSAIGPALTDYMESTKLGTFGAFKLTLGDRNKFINESCKYIERLIHELDRRFKPSVVQESLSTLFDPQHLLKNSKKLDSVEYGRSQLVCLRQKYKNFPGFDCNAVRNEWESFKQPLLNFIQTFSSDCSEKLFWKKFITLKQSTNSLFLEEYKSILILLSIYLISPTNSAECERGFSAVNRIQTPGRSRVMISTLNILMSVRMLLPDDLRSARCQHVVVKAFELWNDKNYSRRLNGIQVLADVSDDYQPIKQVRSVAKRKLSSIQSETINKKPKRPKSYAIKCASGCRTSISSTDPTQYEAIQCCHQSDHFNWIDYTNDCSRWLCNGCRIKFKLTTDSIWFCSDHVDMYSDQDEENDAE